MDANEEVLKTIDKLQTLQELYRRRRLGQI